MKWQSLVALHGGASAEAQHLVARIEAELLLARGLCALTPNHARSWESLIEAGQDEIQTVLSRGLLEAIPAAVAAVEKRLAPLGKMAKRYTVHCVGHAHIDMNWMWSWPETVAVTNDTFLTVLRLMEEYPSFRFSQSQASTYRIVEEHNPALLQRIARRVKEGRWEVTASHWVEGDKNMAGGESLARHLLYTRRYLQQLFGLTPEDVPIDWSPDTFGHAATVPTYLARGGIKYLYLHRPGVHTPNKPGAFWWEGPDGSRVLVRNDMELAYNGVITPDIGRHLLKFVQFTGGTEYMFVFGVGDHGGGPTRRDIVRALDMDTWPVFPNIRFSTTRAFYGALEAQGARLPVIRGELNTEFTGCYTTQTLIKKDNRFAENRLIDAETAATLAAMAAGHVYPAAAFVEGWRDTLFSHFHDILPGSGVHDTRTYTHGLYQKTVAMTGSAETQALRAVAAQIDTAVEDDNAGPAAPPSQIASALGAGVGYRSADGQYTHSEQSVGHGPRPFVIFNPTAFARAEVVEATIWDNAPSSQRPLRSRTFTVCQSDGRVLPAQVIGGGGYWGHDYATLAFPVRVAGLGYARYVVQEETADRAVESLWNVSAAGSGRNPPAGGAWQVGPYHHCAYAVPDRPSEGLENEYVRLDLDPRTGGIRLLRDKRSGVDLITPAQSVPALEYAVERPHGMNAWSIDNAGAIEAPQVIALRRALNGPHKASIEIDLRLHESNLTLTYELRAGDPHLHIHVSGVWFQRGTRETGVPVLTFALPTALQAGRARYEIPFGAIDRAFNQGEEVPALNWAQVTGRVGGKTAGCLLANDSKHGYALQGSTLRLTLIRSAYEPDILPEIGQHEVHLAVLPFAGELPVTRAIQAGQALNRALRVVGTDVHPGRLPATGQLVRVEGNAVVLSGLKRAEDSEDVILRMYNPSTRPTTARVDFDAERVGQAVRARIVDMMERPIGDVRVRRGAVRVKIPAQGIVAVQIEVRNGACR